MKDIFDVLFIFLIVWLVFYILLEIHIIQKRKKNIDYLFQELDKYFVKRIHILYQMIDVIKFYNKIEFDHFHSQLYDYIREYQNYDVNKKLALNEELALEIKKVLLFSTVYPEVKSNNKYMKSEKQLIRYNKVILKLCKKYNKAVQLYEDRKKIFPSQLICLIGHFYDYHYYKIN